jgi:hypothetical protein
MSFGTSTEQGSFASAKKKKKGKKGDLTQSFSFGTDGDEDNTKKTFKEYDINIVLQ